MAVALEGNGKTMAIWWMRRREQLFGQLFLVVEIIAETMAVEALAGEEVLAAALAALAVSAAVVALAAVALVENFNNNFY